MDEPKAPSAGKAIRRFFSRSTNAIILAAATIIAALITALSVSRHGERSRLDEIAHIQGTLTRKIQEIDNLESQVAAKQLRIADLERQLQVLTSTTTSTALETSPTAAKLDASEQADPAVQEAEGITVKLEQCRRSGTTVTCDIVVTNNEKERGVAIYAWGYESASRVVDEHGNEYYVSQGRLGSNVDGTPDALAPTGVSLRGWLRVRDVPTSSRTFKLVQIRMSAGEQFKIEFREVVIAA